MFLDTIIREINSNIIYHKDDKYENIIDYLIGLLTIFKYFTFWILIINIFYLCGYFQKYYNSILFLNTTLVLGSIIMMKKFSSSIKCKIYKKVFSIKGRLYVFLDFFLHYFMFFLILMKGGVRKKNEIIFGLTLSLIYFITFDIYKLYRIKKSIALICLICLSLIYYYY
jgi:hypothetical protein